MIDFLKLLAGALVGLFRSHAAREAEVALLRQQLLVLKRSARERPRLRNADRLIFVWLYRLFPSLLGNAVIFQPATLGAGIGAAFASTGAGSRTVVGSVDLRSRPTSAISSGQ
jgi:hypothetical protein